MRSVALLSGLPASTHHGAEGGGQARGVLEGDEGWAKIKGEDVEMGFLSCWRSLKWCGSSEAIISTVKDIDGLYWAEAQILSA